MNEQRLRSQLSLESEQAIDSMCFVEEIDSTNSEALRQIRAGNTQNRLLVASSQTAGKGRRGRQWLSPKNSGIYLSLTRGFALDANALQGLSLITAISIAEALQELGATGLQLKWPNDVLHQGKKLAGILLELQQKEGACYVVFGVGVNLALSVDSAALIDRPVTDLDSILPAPQPPDALLAALLNRLCANLKEYEDNGFSGFQERWNSLDCYRHCDILILNGESRMIGKSMGVDVDAALLVETTEGLQSITGGEVFPSLRPLSDEMGQS